MARTKTPRNGDAANKPVASTSQIALVPALMSSFKSEEAHLAMRTKTGWLPNVRYWPVIISSRQPRFGNSGSVRRGCVFFVWNAV